MTEDSEQESISHMEDDSLNGAQDPLADNAVVWKDRRGAKVIKSATPSALVYMLADSTIYQGMLPYMAISSQSLTHTHRQGLCGHISVDLRVLDGQRDLSAHVDHAIQSAQAARQASRA